MIRLLSPNFYTSFFQGWSFARPAVTDYARITSQAVSPALDSALGRAIEKDVMRMLACRVFALLLTGRMHCFYGFPL